MRLDHHKKIIEPKIISEFSMIPRPLVFTNGVFDILHRGHITYLEESRKMGKTLLVALNSDKSTKKLNKGQDRPINTLEDRLSIIAALESVSYVTWFENETPLSVIKVCKPDILVKGGDWDLDQIVGSEFVKSSGGTVVSIPFKFQRSTSKMLKKIRQVKNF